MSLSPGFDSAVAEMVAVDLFCMAILRNIVQQLGDFHNVDTSVLNLLDALAGRGMVVWHIAIHVIPAAPAKRTMAGSLGNTCLRHES
jgi:hypothetical protein